MRDETSADAILNLPGEIVRHIGLSVEAEKSDGNRNDFYEEENSQQKDGGYREELSPPSAILPDRIALRQSTRLAFLPCVKRGCTTVPSSSITSRDEYSALL